MAIGVIIDRPDPMFSDNDEWLAFLDEMKLLKERSTEMDTIIEADRQIKFAERVLAERRIARAQ